MSLSVLTPIKRISIARNTGMNVQCAETNEHSDITLTPTIVTRAVIFATIQEQHHIPTPIAVTQAAMIVILKEK